MFYVRLEGHCAPVPYWQCGGKEGMRTRPSLTLQSLLIIATKRGAAEAKVLEERNIASYCRISVEFNTSSEVSHKQVESWRQNTELTRARRNFLQTKF